MATASLKICSPHSPIPMLKQPPKDPYESRNQQLESSWQVPLGSQISSILIVGRMSHHNEHLDLTKPRQHTDIRSSEIKFTQLSTPYLTCKISKFWSQTLFSPPFFFGATSRSPNAIRSPPPPLTILPTSSLQEPAAASHGRLPGASQQKQCRYESTDRT